ncbi:diguanylate cyclase [Pseudomonas putida]|nr:diguanylate cyclase [Pseudomonas putida]NVN67360.1 diguanylate cyclase [Pseudomonas putida]
MGAGVLANTGEAGAMHRSGSFAGMPAPTGTASAFGASQHLWERVYPRTAQR